MTMPDTITLHPGREYVSYAAKILGVRDGKTIIVTPGVVFGNTDRGRPEVVYCSGDWAVVKEPGNTYWSSTLQPSAYSPTEYHLINTVTWEDRAEATPGRRWKKCLDWMKAEADRLASSPTASAAL
jgi:hypothetical protein